MEVLRQGVESELKLPSYTTATAIGDPRHGCDRHLSSLQHRSLNPLSKDRDQTCNLSVPSQIRTLALLSGLRIWHCHELWCRFQMHLRSVLLWVWFRLAAVADSIPSLGMSIC